MGSAKTVDVGVQALRDAFDLVSAGEQYDSRAWICLGTGKIYWRSDASGLEDEDLPEDLEDSDRYLAVPSQRNLDLGRRLALDFAAAELPDDYDAVSQFFRRRGAYARFKDLLDARGVLTRWHEFENQATDEALRAWCAAHGIRVVPDAPLA